MFHFSTDRLAGLDAPILKITASPKVPTLVPNHSLRHDMHIAAWKLKTREPLADNLAPRPPQPTASMLLHTLATSHDVAFLSCKDPLLAPYPPDIPSFRPLPPVPSASTLQLPSFLNFSSQSFTSYEDPPCRSLPSPPASTLFRISSSPQSPVAVPKTKPRKVLEGPQWIPAFHHPNSPYVPWPSPIRRRILAPPSPLSPSPVCPSSPCIRSGAVAPEPWASSTFSQAHRKSGRERLSSSWKNLKNSIRKGVQSVVSRLGSSGKALGMLCTSQDVLRAHYDSDCVVAAQPDHAMQSTAGKAPAASRDSLASFSSSDSTTLAAWLAERRATASEPADHVLREMSVGEYELMGSWLDLRACDGDWTCGIPDCDMHTADGSPCVANAYPIGLWTAMPLDCTEVLPVTESLPSECTRPFPTRSCARPRFHSLPRLPYHSFDIYPAQDAKRATDTTRCRELSMPGGWTFH